MSMTMVTTPLRVGGSRDPGGALRHPGESRDLHRPATKAKRTAPAPISKAASCRVSGQRLGGTVGPVLAAEAGFLLLAVMGCVAAGLGVLAWIASML